MSLLKTGAGYVTRNFKDAVGPASVGLGAVGATEAERHRRGGSKGRDVATAATAGATAGAYRAVGLGVIQRRGKQQEHAMEGQTKSQYKKLVKEHKAAHGVAGLEGPPLRAALKTKPNYFRQYPKTLGGWKYKRALGHMSGPRGRAIEAATVALPSLAVAHRPKQVTASKRADLEVHQRKTSAARVVGVGAGSSALALGLSGSGYTGRALARGTKIPGRTGVNFATAARIDGQIARRATQAGVLVHRNPGIGGLVDLVPAKLRYPILAGAGYGLARESMPVRRDTYRPFHGATSTGW